MKILRERQKRVTLGYIKKKSKNYYESDVDDEYRFTLLFFRMNVIIMLRINGEEKK